MNHNMILPKHLPHSYFNTIICLYLNGSELFKWFHQMFHINVIQLGRVVLDKNILWVFFSMYSKLHSIP